MSKRYIYVCAGCDLLAESSRSHATTCSPACRVRAHRSGSLKRLQKTITHPECTPAQALQAAAVLRLCPELEDPIWAGTMTIKQAQPTVCNAFDEVLRNYIRERRAEVAA